VTALLLIVYYKQLVTTYWQALKMTELKKLSLNDHHLAQGAKLTSFAGWNMPVSYGSSLREHKAVRESVGLFDVSHMGEIEVTGEDAAGFLDYALTNDINKCRVGQAQYSLLCGKDGGTLDDLIVYRRETQKFFLCVNASNTNNDFLTLLERSSDYQCEVKNVSDSFGQLALQGPSAEKTLSDLISQDLSNLNKMGFTEGTWMGSPTMIARTGYTGEDGFEIYTEHKSLKSWVHAFEHLDVPWVGLAARDSLRLEAGFPLYGHELSKSITPVQAGLSWAIGWEKSYFCGKEALLREKDQPTHRVVHFIVHDRRIPREGCNLMSPEGKEAGVVLSGGFSPLINMPMGSGLIMNNFWNHRADSGWHAMVRGTQLPIEIGLPPLRKPKKEL